MATVTPVIEFLCTALEGGARIIWDERTIRGPREAVIGLREEPEATRAIMRRAELFRRQLLERGPNLPAFVLDAVSRQGEGCYSCGEPHRGGGRCPACRVAVYLAMDLIPPRDVSVSVETIA